jgi:hypothetical protein
MSFATGKKSFAFKPQNKGFGNKVPAFKGKMGKAPSDEEFDLAVSDRESDNDVSRTITTSKNPFTVKKKVEDPDKLTEEFKKFAIDKRKSDDKMVATMKEVINAINSNNSKVLQKYLESNNKILEKLTENSNLSEALASWDESFSKSDDIIVIAKGDVKISDLENAKRFKSLQDMLNGEEGERMVVETVEEVKEEEEKEEED